MEPPFNSRAALNRLPEMEVVKYLHESKFNPHVAYMTNGSKSVPVTTILDDFGIDRIKGYAAYVAGYSHVPELLNFFGIDHIFTGGSYQPVEPLMKQVKMPMEYFKKLTIECGISSLRVYRDAKHYMNRIKRGEKINGVIIDPEFVKEWVSSKTT